MLMWLVVSSIASIGAALGYLVTTEYTMVENTTCFAFSYVLISYCAGNFYIFI
jgi:hypothetical protein